MGVREAGMERVPYMVVVGDGEIASKKLKMTI